MLAACAADPSVSELDEDLYGRPLSYWPRSSRGDVEVPVCWVTSGYATEKGWVRSSVETEWGQHTSIKFTGWGDCGPATARVAVRIAVDNGDQNPSSLVGITDASPSMHLKFRFTEWDSWFWKDGWLYTHCNSSEGQEPCIRSLALHEFGHALGFAHEQVHPGNNGDCNEFGPNDAGDDGFGDQLTTYDHDSIMNYCADSGAQAITTKDIIGSQQVYPLASAPVTAVRLKDGRLFVAGRDADGTVRYTSQMGPGGAWTPPAALAGTVLGHVAVAQHDNGRVIIFARGPDSVLRYVEQVAPNGPFATSWTGIYALGMKDQPVVVTHVDGRLEVFARGLNDMVYGSLQQVRDGSTWGVWTLTGLTTAAGPPAATLNYYNRPDVFVRTQAGPIAHVVRTASGTWSSVGTLGAAWTSDPVVIRDYGERLSVFVRGKNKQIQVARETGLATGAFGSFSSIGSTSLTSAPAVGMNADGRLRVIARGPAGTVLQNWQTTPSGSWGGWLQADPAPVRSGVAVARNLDGRLEIFTRGSDMLLDTAYEQQPNGVWTGLLDRPLFAYPVTRRIFTTVNSRAVTWTGDWSPNFIKAECGDDEVVSGLSVAPSAVGTHAALCGVGKSAHGACYPLVISGGDARMVTTTGDWDPGYYKGECGADAAVLGMSQAPVGATRALLCCSAAGITHNACSTLVLPGDQRESGASGDWDPGYYKLECGPGRHVAGVSRSPTTGVAHAILCCGS